MLNAPLFKDFTSILSEIEAIKTIDPSSEGYLNYALQHKNLLTKQLQNNIDGPSMTPRDVFSFKH